MKLFNTMSPGPSDDAQLHDVLGKTFTENDRLRLVDGYRESLEARGAAAEASDISAAIGTDRMFRMPGIRLAEAHLAHGDDVYMYLFDWQTSFFNLGACHALELAYVFGTQHESRLESFFDGAKPGADELSAAMMKAWCKFASTGNPSVDEPAPNYAQNRSTLIFGVECRTDEDPYPAERHLWDQLDHEIGKM